MLSYPNMSRSKTADIQCTPTMSFNFPHSHFALMYINRSGELQVESSPSISGYEKGIFTQDVKDKFLKSATVGWQPSFQSGTASHMDGEVTGKSPSFPPLQHPWYQQQQPSLIPCEWQSFQNKRHRRNMRRAGSTFGPDSDSVSPTPSIRWSALRVANQDLLRTYYDKAFENFQQLNCRAIAKAFVKLVEPRKQVNHPYNGRKTTGGSSQRVDPELTKPKWWPSGVTHREPDHLLKADRIRLLVHILCELRESHGITAGKLKEAGQDVRRQIMPTERAQVLDEIYYVREMEELYLEGKISGDTVIHVSHVHMGEACLASELQTQTADSSFGPSLSTTTGKRDAPELAESHHYHNMGHEVHPGSFNDGHPTAGDIYLTKAPTDSGTCVPLSPTSSHSISRKSSLESSLTTYSTDLNPSMLTTSEPSRALCASKDVTSHGVSSLPDYFTQQMASATTGHGGHGFWHGLPPTHHALAFQGY
ncbi:hypothetical protein FE257_000472 [Aspergillus nanangensis]|uniref:Subtelomeric hrmA-associated cluster protein AFUB-079030/YDR124W-like helical bundle domain-containing protein n=1 Tax=Aspergillus nanangensis TaxID=2582783 RepID=A0AAD4CUV7_ASPNN|nr:hypothetical protein FE257_000472 [Aspergillus nanangensis]